MTTAWLELSLRLAPELVEAIAEVFGRYGQGVAIEGVVLPLEGPSEPDVLAPVVADDTVVLKTYLHLDGAAWRDVQRIDVALGHLSVIWPLPRLDLRVIDEAQWANAWREHFHTFRLGRRLVVKPPWEAYAPQPDDLVIELEPGLAFGTGLHPSTRLCAEAMEARLTPGMTVLDLGTGSGILAIAAAKLGAASVLALDVDPTAGGVATANVAANGVASIVRVELGSMEAIPAGAAFDLVVANILARVIADLARELVAALRPGGVLITGGIIAEHLESVQRALAAAGGADVAVSADGDWRTVVCRRA